jgi:hypothetical protein
MYLTVLYIERAVDNEGMNEKFEHIRKAFRFFGLTLDFCDWFLDCFCFFV